jgi:hypothetical protein
VDEGKVRIGGSLLKTLKGIDAPDSKVHVKVDQVVSTFAVFVFDENRVY